MSNNRLKRQEAPFSKGLLTIFTRKCFRRNKYATYALRVTLQYHDSAKTTASESGASEVSAISAIETFHAGETHTNLYGHKRGTRSQENEVINQWMTTASGARSRRSVDPRLAAVKAKANIRSSLVSKQDQYDASYSRPDTPRGSLMASAAAATAASATLEAFKLSAQRLSDRLDRNQEIAASAATSSGASTSKSPTSGSNPEAVAAQSYPIAAARAPSPAPPAAPSAPSAPPAPLAAGPHAGSPQHGVRPARRSFLRPVMRMRPISFGQPAQFLLGATDATETTRTRIFREFVPPVTSTPELEVVTITSSTDDDADMATPTLCFPGCHCKKV